MIEFLKLFFFGRGVPFWHFWNLNSGFIGGMIMSLIVVAILHFYKAG